MSRYGTTMLKPILVALSISTFLILIEKSLSCNEAVCGSIVSKCLLTQACKCDYTNCTCCKECIHCLNERFPECCSCVEMCPKPNSIQLGITKHSSIEDFPEKVPVLFKALTEEQISDQWTSYTFPVQFPNAIQVSNNFELEYKLHFRTSDHKTQSPENCTVAFTTDCMSQAKCSNHCMSMGASSARWFHNGCCECIGEYCINYGIAEAKCKKCSSDVNSIEDEDNYVYDEDEEVWGDEEMDEDDVDGNV